MRYILLFLFITVAFTVNAQVNDSSLVVNQGDPSIEKLPVEGNTLVVEMANEQIPASIRKTLSMKQYKGWENSSLYYDKTTQLYWLEICKENKPVRHFFDKEGKPATGTGKKK